MTVLIRFGNYLRARQRWVLLAMLAVLHLALLAGVQSTVGLMCWLVDVGLFILWQPFIQSERKLGVNSLLLITLALLGGVWIYGWWLLMLWVVMLAALLGGRVLLLGHRPTRIFYLLAFAYLLAALLIYLVPKVVPNETVIGPLLDDPFAVAGPLIFMLMLLLPQPREFRLPGSGMVDFFYSLFIFLLISVLVLGSLAFMLLSGAVYIEAVFKTLFSMAAMLLLIAWAWNPRPGFSGIGVFLSRYLLSLGLPFETWLQRLMDCAERESDPDRFLLTAVDSMLELPWVAGGSWAPAGAEHAGSGTFGQTSEFRVDFSNRPLLLTLYTRHKLSPSLIWHFNLLAQLTNEYYITKQRARELQQMSYLRAVHETGARLTHDVKNLLQSLSNLCFMAQAPDDTDGKAFNTLMQRQLPQIAQRLQQTLEKLQAPQLAGAAEEHGDLRPAVAWWDELQQRYAHGFIKFAPVDFLAGACVALPLFDGVADNLLNNALLKQQTEDDLVVTVMLSPDASVFSVCDNGSVLREDIEGFVLRAPVASENGLGIGLYHAARQAELYGYALRLLSNVAGRVCFELRKAV